MQLNELIEKVTGPIFLPGSTEYIEEQRGYQTGFSNKPSIIVGAVEVNDICLAVKYAKQNNLAIAIEATGHGRVKAESGAVLVSTKRMKQININPSDKTAEIEAGVCWGEVIQRAAAFGLAPINGSAASVGAISYVLGGGLGILGRQYGYAADHVHWFDLITADGSLQRVDTHCNQELFSALCGAGANFGIVSKLKISLVPIRKIYGGHMYFDSSLVPEVLEKFIAWTKTVPVTLTSSLSVLKLPNLDIIPSPIRGRHVAQIRIAFSGDDKEGERLLAPLRALGPRLIDTVQEMSYLNVEEIYRDPPMPHAYTGNNILVSDVDSVVQQAVMDYSMHESEVMCVIDIRHLGGRLKEQPAVPRMISHRDAEYLVRVLSPVAPDQFQVVENLHNEFLATMQHLAIGRQLNFIYGKPTNSDYARQAYSDEKYNKLVKLKQKYDPSNMFRINYNVV